MDSVWHDEDFHSSTSHSSWTKIRDIEWSKMSSEFTDVGYREGITAGKEAAIQGGFDAGFVGVGVPLGRELGLLRGYASALLTFLPSPTALLGDDGEEMVSEVRDINRQLGIVRYSDIEPRDLEAEQHAREHLDGEEMQDVEALDERKRMEGLEDALVGFGLEEEGRKRGRPTMEDVLKLKRRLIALCAKVGLVVLVEA